MSRVWVRLKAWATRVKVKLFPIEPQHKVTTQGVWQEGSVDDFGDFFVAHITVNGAKNAVMVKGQTRKLAEKRRAAIITAMMGSAPSSRHNPVQLIARTDGNKTVEYL